MIRIGGTNPSWLPVSLTMATRDRSPAGDLATEDMGFARSLRHRERRYPLPCLHRGRRTTTS